VSQLPLYQCHKVVRAAKIISITTGFNDRHTELVLDVPDPACPNQGHLSVMVSDLWTARNPQLAVGGYFVEYQESDKYTAYSPSGPFEGGYTLITE
jgi:hypothetical protein